MRSCSDHAGQEKYAGNSSGMAVVSITDLLLHHFFVQRAFGLSRRARFRKIPGSFLAVRDAGMG
jgi:hypothetical protein